MNKTIKAAFAATVLSAGLAAAPAFAQEEPASDLTITGSVALTTEYRLRGISQTDGDAAIQGGITVAHSSGFYVSTWASNLAGNGTWGGSNMELDLIAGYSRAIGPVTLDGGFIYYAYPGVTGHDFYEIYGSASGAVGPVKAKLGAYWAPSQNSIRTGPSKGNNIWVYTDFALPIEGTPLTLKAHGGYSSGDSIYTWGKDVIDYAAGVDITFKVLTLNVSYVGTDLPRDFANANFGAGSESGRSITRGKVVATLTAAF
ncbi:MAG: TorF family putative porin [Pseudomonadota bacterium]